MSLYLAVELSNDTKKLLAEKQLILKQNCEGNFEDPTRFHITVRFLAEDQVDNGLAMSGLKLYEELYQPKRFEVFARGFYTFDQGVSWVGVHNSLPLYEAKKQLEECLIQAGFPLKQDTFKGYTPHITMAYDFKEKQDFSKDFVGIPIIVDNISLWNGFKANDVYIHNKIYGVSFK